MNQSHIKKNRRKERDRPIPYQIHRYRENFALSWLGSIFLHVLFFTILFFLPMPYKNISPSITLEIWEPEEAPPASEEENQEKDKMPYVGQMPYVTSRYRDLQYHPQAKQNIPPRAPAKPVAPGRKAPAAVVKAKSVPNTTHERMAQEVLTFEEKDEALAEVEEAVQVYEDEYTQLNNKEILGEELSSILDSEGNAQWLGDTLMNLQMSKRNLIIPPDLNFLTQEGFTSNIKVVRIRLTISPDGTVSNVTIVFPGTGNPELDRRLRLAFLQVVFNDVRSFGREAETGTIVLNFKG